MSKADQTKKSTATPRVGEEAGIIGQNLKNLRKEGGYSQRQVAAEIGTSFQQIQKYEKGQNRIPAERLHRLKTFFGVSYASFFEGLPTAAIIKSPAGKAEMARTLGTKISNIDDDGRRQKIFRAFMILVSD